LARTPQKLSTSLPVGFLLTPSGILF
jgi:hypothetical protein